MRPLLMTALVLAAATAGAQDAPRPAGQGGGAVVRVDLYPTEAGRIVDGLTRDDIDVLEDGVPQAIDTLEQVRLVPPASSDAGAAPGGRAAEPTPRLFAIFLDTYHTPIARDGTLRRALVRFLDRVLGPDDLAAVMTPEMAATDVAVSGKAALIRNLLQDPWSWTRGGAGDRDSKDRLYEGCFDAATAQEMIARRREALTLDALSTFVAHLQGQRLGRTAVLAVTEGWLLYADSRQLARSARRDAERQDTPGTFRRGRPEPADRPGVGGVSRTECDADRQALASLDHARRLRAIADQANRATVSFYPVYAPALAAAAPGAGDAPAVPVPAQDAANARTRQDSLLVLAEGTDGLAAVAGPGLEGAAARIVADLSSYYLLSYTSSNTRLDGRFRAISVRVRRAGVTVRARRGYRGLTAAELVRDRGFDGEGAAASPSAVAVDTRAPFRIRASSWGPQPAGAPVEGPAGAGTGMFWVVGELDYSTQRELVWTAGAQAEVTVVAADGREVLAATVPVPAADGGFALRVPEVGGVAPGEYAVRVRVRPDGDTARVLTDTARVVVPPAAGVLGDAVLWRRGPATGPQFVRTADPRFRRSERLRLELPTRAEGAATARMLDRAGNPMQVPVQVAERAGEGGAFRWIVADVALAPLAMGDYAIDVTLDGRSQVTAFRIVP